MGGLELYYSAAASAGKRKRTEEQKNLMLKQKYEQCGLLAFSWLCCFFCDPETVVY